LTGFIPPIKVFNHIRINSPLLLWLNEAEYHILQGFRLIGSFQPLPEIRILLIPNLTIEPIHGRALSLTTGRPTHHPASKDPQLKAIGPLVVKPLILQDLRTPEFLVDIQRGAQLVAVVEGPHVHQTQEAGHQVLVDKDVVGVKVEYR
jgi:hypothetical protein